jgi:hypothetical protein
MLSWRDLVEPVGEGIKRVASSFGPVASLIAEEGVELAKFGISSAEDGLTIEAIIQQLQDRHFDLLNKLKGDG